MNSGKEKNIATLQITGAIIAVLSLCVIFFIFTKKISPIWIIFFCMASEVFLAIPVFNVYYYKLWDQDLGPNTFKAFIPVYNYTMTMSKLFGWITIALFILIGISLLSTLVPSIFKMFGHSFLFMFVYRFPIYMITIVGITSIVIGIGLYDTVVQVEKKYNETFPSVQSNKKFKLIETIYRIVPFAGFVFCVLPLFRLIPILSCIDKETSLYDLGIRFTEREGE